VRIRVYDTIGTIVLADGADHPGKNFPKTPLHLWKRENVID
jgi:hypothetical protein